MSLSAALSLTGGLTLAAALGTPRWLGAQTLCEAGAQLVNVSGGPDLDKFRGVMSMGLFTGSNVRQCGLGPRPTTITVFPAMLFHEEGALLAATCACLGAACACALGSAALALYNAMTRPYRLLLGTAGIHLAGGATALLAWVAVAMFCGLAFASGLVEQVSNAGEPGMLRVLAERVWLSDGAWLALAAPCAVGFGSLAAHTACSAPSPPCCCCCLGRRGVRGGSGEKPVTQLGDELMY